MGVKCGKNKPKKIVGNFVDNFRWLYLNGTLTYKCLALFKQQKILDSIFLQKEILEKTVDVRNRLQGPFFLLSELLWRSPG